MDINEKIDELSILCACISPFVKSSDWAYEKEFRIVVDKYYPLKMNKKQLLIDFEKNTIDPYVFYPISPNALDEIIIGPKENYSVIEHIIRNELKECLLNEVKIPHSSLELV